MLTKQCARPGCSGTIEARYPSELKRRTYCCWRCTQWAAVVARKRGSADVRRSAKQIQLAIGVTGDPSAALIRAVQRIRSQAYRAGWTVVQRRVQRAVARGVLVRTFAPAEKAGREVAARCA